MGVPEFGCEIVVGFCTPSTMAVVRDPRRRFSRRQRAVLYLVGGGRCQECGVRLARGWHADHVVAHARGGRTDIRNGQALCAVCNLKKGVGHVSDERQWQIEVRDEYFRRNQRDFLIAATPAAGKTTAALDIASRLVSRGEVSRVVVVVPTDALREQWAVNAAAFGLQIKPVREPEDYEKPGYQGCVVTYAQLAMGSGADYLRRALRIPTMVVLDEIHHAGDQRSWGTSLAYAVEDATRRLSLTGTPWRRDRSSLIPFCRYSADGLVRVDYEFDYGRAVAEGVCRPIEFDAYRADDVRWVDAGRVTTTELGPDLTDAHTNMVLETVYQPEGQWIQTIFRHADAALTELAAEVPDVAGLVVAEDQFKARAYAEVLTRLTGQRPALAISDDPDAREVINRFRTGRERWLVAVRMVSEGVDIPRLAVGVFAAKWRTPLFFRQVMGRFVRLREGETFNARLLIPAVPTLLEQARQVEEMLRHQLELVSREPGPEGEPGEPVERAVAPVPLSASDALFDRAIFQGQDVPAEELATAQAQCQRSGIPIQYALNVVQLLRSRVGQQPAPLAPPPPATLEPRHQRERLLRAEVKSMVNRMAHYRGLEPQELNTILLRAGFPKRSLATVEELERIQEWLVRWSAQIP
jgi:superfamily II DNA or RNA helicase